jgi:hypothetical protein
MALDHVRDFFNERTSFLEAKWTRMGSTWLCVSFSRWPASPRNEKFSALFAKIERTKQNVMAKLDQPLKALFFVALLLYLIPAAVGGGISREHRRRFRLAAIVTLGVAMAVAVVASLVTH